MDDKSQGSDFDENSQESYSEEDKNQSGRKGGRQGSDEDNGSTSGLIREEDTDEMGDQDIP